MARHVWVNQAEYLFTACGFAVGLGNLWRYPFMAYRNGGGSFVIAYICCNLLLGFSGYMMEAALGQYSRSGPLAVWNIQPLLKGLGFTFMLCYVIAQYTHTVILWCVYYLIASCTDTLPWMNCDNWFNDFRCNMPKVSSCSVIGSNTSENGVCYQNNTSVIIGIDNETLAQQHGVISMSSTEQFYFLGAVGETPESSFTNLGSIHLPLIGIHIFLSALFFAIFVFGLKFVGKIAYFTSGLPLIGLIAMLINGFIIEGGTNGMEMYLTPDFSRLLEARVWFEAAIQMFFSLGVYWGGNLALASYNPYHTNIFRNSIVIIAADFCVSMLSGLVVFAHLGNMALNMDKDISEVVADGPGLVFIVYPIALALLPWPRFWSIWFFLTVTFLGLSSVLGFNQTLYTVLLDFFPTLGDSRKGKITAAAIMLVYKTPTALLCITQGGYWVLTYFDFVAMGWPVCVIASVQVVGVFWSFGWHRLVALLDDMMPWFTVWRLSRLMLRFLFTITPLLSMAVVAMILFANHSVEARGYKYPNWSLTLAQIVRALVLAPLVGVAVYEMVKNRNNLRAVLQPDPSWIPTAKSASFEDIELL